MNKLVKIATIADVIIKKCILNGLKKVILGSMVMDYNHK